MQARLGGRHRARPDDLQLLAARGLAAEPRVCGPVLAQVAQELIADVRLHARQHELVVHVVARGEAGAAVQRRELQVAAGESKANGVAKAGDGVVVPEQAVVAVGHDEGDGDVHVVLAQLDVLAIHVHLRVLVLPQAVEGFPRAAIELGGWSDEGLAFDRDRLEVRADRLQHGLALGVEELDPSVLQGHLCRGLASLERHAVSSRLEAEPAAGLGNRHQRGQLLARRVIDPSDLDDGLGDGVDAQLLDAARVGPHQHAGGRFLVAAGQGGRGQRHPQRGGQHRKQAGCGHGVSAWEGCAIRTLASMASPGVAATRHLR